MPQLWINDSAGNWAMRSLTGENCLAVSFGEEVCFTPPVNQPGLADIRLLTYVAAGAPRSWALLAGRDAPLWVNGQPLSLGFGVLRDRDEITVAGRRCFFSTEELACVVGFPGLAQAASCPRCRQRLEPGQPAVACPRCHAWHHQSDQFPCWTYDVTCALCQIQSTAMDVGYSWTPEQI